MAARASQPLLARRADPLPGAAHVLPRGVRSGERSGPVLARLVRERDAAATSALQAAIAGASPDEIREVRRQLVEEVGRGGPQARIPLDFMAGGERYQLMVPFEDARPIMSELDAAQRHAEATRGGARESPRGSAGGSTAAARPSAGTRIVRDLRESLLGAVTALLMTASDVGDETEVELEVGVPVAGILGVVGRISLTVGRSADGYSVEAQPELGLSLSVQGQAQGALLTGLTLRAQGHDARTTAQLLGLAIEQRIRAMGSEPPPPFVIVALGATGAVVPFLPVVAGVLDAAYRAETYLESGEARDPFWPWLAGCLFDEDYAERTARQMRRGDYAESVDTLRGRGRAEQEGPEMSVEGSIGLGRHRRTEARDGAGGAEVTTRRYDTLDLSFEFETAGPDFAVEAHFPLRRGRSGSTAPAGQIELKASVPLGAVGQELMDTGAIVRLLDRVAQELERHPDGDDHRAAVESAQAAADGLAAGVQASLYPALRAARARASQARSAVEITVTFDLGPRPSGSASVALTETLEVDAGDESVEVTRSHEVQ